jgi:hypothetical protein
VASKPKCETSSVSTGATTESDLLAELAEIDRKEQAEREAAISRVRLVIEEGVERGIPYRAQLLRRCGRFGKIGALLADLDAIPAACQYAPGVRFLQEGVRMGVILKFLDSFIDAQGLYPAAFYREHFGIPATRLRKAVEREQLIAHKSGTTTRYALADVRALWPQDVTFEP